MKIFYLVLFIPFFTLAQLVPPHSGDKDGLKFTGFLPVPIPREARDLHSAIYMGSFYHVKKLVEEGADVNEKNRRGETPLHWACRDSFFDNNRKSVLYLIENGAKIDIPNNSGKAPLEYWSSHEEIPPDILLDNTPSHMVSEYKTSKYYWLLRNYFFSIKKYCRKIF